MIWLWGAVYGGLEPQTYNITQAQTYQKATPHLKRYISVRVHPYAHPQHLKVLKHFVYIVYGIWMWDAVNGGLQPQQ